ncbi:hypothetical protein TNCV_455781 [Trichonephila clavipes]|nr:hypothetical protein TNCV_455781 [Trichonephila clavipes]
MSTGHDILSVNGTKCTQWGARRMRRDGLLFPSSSGVGLKISFNLDYYITLEFSVCEAAAPQGPREMNFADWRPESAEQRQE